jgi:hypothetical protein
LFTSSGRPHGGLNAFKAVVSRSKIVKPVAKNKYDQIFGPGKLHQNQRPQDEIQLRGTLSRAAQWFVGQP